MDLREFAHTKLLIAQRLNRFVSSSDFDRAFAKADRTQRKRMQELIDKLDLKPLQDLVKRLTNDDLESLSFRDLRELAKQWHVRYWHQLPKDSLIYEIEAAMRKKNETDNSDEHRGDVRGDEDPGNEIGDSPSDV